MGKLTTICSIENVRIFLFMLLRDFLAMGFKLTLLQEQCLKYSAIWVCFILLLVFAMLDCSTFFLTEKMG